VLIGDVWCVFESHVARTPNLNDRINQSPCTRPTCYNTMASPGADSSSITPLSSEPQPEPTVDHIISGTVPGQLDATQTTRLLSHPTHKLSFSSFDPLTATPSDLSGLRRLSLNEELYRRKRIVIETAPNGESIWRFVPSAKGEEGCTDEGSWPRVVEVGE
jgi:hypothetical protein